MYSKKILKLAEAVIIIMAGYELTRLWYENDTTTYLSFNHCFCRRNLLRSSRRKRSFPVTFIIGPKDKTSIKSSVSCFSL